MPLKTIPLILILILALTLTGCQQQLTQKVKESAEKETEKETHSGWRSFENEKHKFVFKYSDGWELSENADRQDLYSLTLVKKDASQEKIMVYTEEMVPSYAINISVEGNPENFSAKDSYLDMFAESSKTQAEEGIEEVSFAGVKAIKYPEVSAPSSGPATGILLTHNQKLYRFVYSALAHKETHEKFLPEFMEILGTLKFVE